MQATRACRQQAQQDLQDQPVAQANEVANQGGQGEPNQNEAQVIMNALPAAPECHHCPLC